MWQFPLNNIYMYIDVAFYTIQYSWWRFFEHLYLKKMARFSNVRDFLGINFSKNKCVGAF